MLDDVLAEQEDRTAVARAATRRRRYNIAGDLVFPAAPHLHRTGPRRPSNRRGIVSCLCCLSMITIYGFSQTELRKSGPCGAV